MIRVPFSQPSAKPHFWEIRPSSYGAFVPSVQCQSREEARTCPRAARQAEMYGIITCPSNKIKGTGHEGLKTAGRGLKAPRYVAIVAKHSFDWTGLSKQVSLSRLNTNVRQNREFGRRLYSFCNDGASRLT